MRTTSRAVIGVLCFLSGIWSRNTEAQEQEDKTADSDAPLDLATPVADTPKSPLPEPLWPPPDPPGSELTERGRNVRGIYLPVGVLVTKPVEEIVELVTEKLKATAVVLDLKDDHGRVTFSSSLPLAKGPPHGIVRNMAALVEQLRARDVYLIGRLVCFKDDVSTARRPRSAIIDRKTGKLWRNPTGNAWLDPYSDEAADLIVGVAKAAVELGFDEIQLDYVRFPVDPLTRDARFANKKAGVRRYEAIASLLYKIDQAIDRPLSADVFGLTAFHGESAELLGQVVERLAPYLDALSPMLYLANWPPKYWQNPDHKTSTQLTFSAIERLRRRLGDAVVIRPLLQGFRYRNSLWGARYIEDQINASLTAGSSGYLFWNQSGKYGDVGKVWARLDEKGASASGSVATTP